MSTPVINAINNVNDATLKSLFQAVANNIDARVNLSKSNRNIDAVSTNVSAIEGLNNTAEAILLVLTRREGRDPANYADLNEVAADISLVNDFAVREASTNIITHADNAHTAISASDRATRSMMTKAAGLDPTTFTDVSAVASDASAMSTIAADAQASRGMAAVPLAMQAVAASSSAMQEIAASSSAMPEVAASPSAMQEIAASSSAMNTIFTYQTAMDAVINSSTAANEVFTNGATITAFTSGEGPGQDTATSQAVKNIDLTNLSEVVVSGSFSTSGPGSFTQTTELRIGSKTITSPGTYSISQSGTVVVELYAFADRSGSSDNTSSATVDLDGLHFNS